MLHDYLTTSDRSNAGFLTFTMPDTPISVFISYAHRDERLKERFLVHLAALKRERLIGVWHDQMLKPGEHLDRSIENELAAADVVILLISPDFINSDYCTEKEMQRAFARAKVGRCKAVAVILKPCGWRNIPIDEEGGRLGDFLVTPRDGKPVTQWPQGREAAWDSVVADIRRLISDNSASGIQDDSSAATDVIRPATVKIERDVWLADAIWRVFLGTWDLPPHAERAPVGPEENQRFYDLVTKEFRQAMYDGRLPISAKRGNYSDLWEAVHKDYWRDRRISYLNVVREDPIKLSVENVGGKFKRADEWREFMTTKSAVDAIWPVEIAPADPTAVPVAGKPVLRLGSQGEDVAYMQQLIGAEVDGKFGPRTELRVRAFQVAHGLQADGVVGKLTWDALLADPNFATPKSK